MKSNSFFALLVVSSIFFSLDIFGAESEKEISSRQLFANTAVGKTQIFKELAERQAKALADGTFGLEITFAPDSKLTATDYVNQIAEKLFQFEWVSSQLFSNFYFLGHLYLDFGQLSADMASEILQRIFKGPILLPNGNQIDLSSKATLTMALPKASAPSRKNLASAVNAIVTSMYNAPTEIFGGTYIFYETANPVRDALCEKIIFNDGVIKFDPKYKLTPK